MKAIAEKKLGWNEIGIINYHFPTIESDEEYIPAGVYVDKNNNFEGMHLVLRQYMESPDVIEWYLNQEFVLALGLKRENDIWVCPTEGYIEVARLKRNPDGVPCLLEVRAEHLKDYLCARKMALFISTFMNRQFVNKNKPQFTWKDNEVSTKSENDEWTGTIRAIHKGGNPFGGEIAVMRVTRTDVSKTDDIPEIKPISSASVKTKSWRCGFSGDKYFNICGQIWKNEWVEPSKHSPRILKDILPATVYFKTNTEGELESRNTLINEGKWLWFAPTLVKVILERRGGSLVWYSAQTGAFGCLQNCSVHFGINSLGLITVYAKDVALLPDWQQQIWAGHNVGPEGKVSEELLASQVDAEPASTEAPETLLQNGIEQIKNISRDKLGFSIFKEIEDVSKIYKKCHRFRSIDQSGLYELAKDLTKLIVESIDSSQIKKYIKQPNDKNLGSLKLLEKLLFMKIGEKSKIIMGPLFGLYDLRLADAHLSNDDNSVPFSLLGIDNSIPYINQGFQMLDSCYKCINNIISVLNEW